MVGNLTTPGSEQDALHPPPPAPAVGRNGGTVHKNGRRVLAEGRRIQPEGLGRKVVPFSTGLSGIHARYHRLHLYKLIISEESSDYQAIYCSKHLQTRNGQQSSMQQTRWTIRATPALCFVGPWCDVCICVLS
jgi:hypothetical protein